MPQVDGLKPHSKRSLSELPVDELQAYAAKLGISPPRDAAQGELLRLIRERQEALLAVDRQALLDICVWARRPVRESAGKEELAQEIAAITKMRFDGLSDAGLQALCRLRDIDTDPGADRDTLIRALKKAESWGGYLKRKRRRLVGSLISRLVSGSQAAENGAQQYQFLPEEDVPLKQRIEEEGIVGGLTRKFKGVADDYVREKLDEIEMRIDRKLDEIDRRLGEWRDREIRNRLRIVKITLIASIIVAAVSLGYDYVKGRAAGAGADQEISAQDP